jgi:hypothetical protein
VPVHAQHPHRDDVGDRLDDGEEIGLGDLAAEGPALAVGPADERVEEAVQHAADLLLDRVALRERGPYRLHDDGDLTQACGLHVEGRAEHAALGQVGVHPADQVRVGRQLVAEEPTHGLVALVAAVLQRQPRQDPHDDRPAVAR